MNLPRIYTYKITFPYQGWWYWGVHEEKKYGEFYMGSPSTHKEKWKFFYHEKQILEIFDSVEKAYAVERRLIKSDLDNPMCLNENCGGYPSFAARSKGGKNAAFFKDPEVRKKAHEKSLKTRREQELGFHNREVQAELGRRAAKVNRKNKTSIFDPEVQSRGGKKGGKNTGNQKWMCLVTGYVTAPGALSLYQKKRGIDTSMRKRIM